MEYCAAIYCRSVRSVSVGKLGTIFSTVVWPLRALRSLPMLARSHANWPQQGTLFTCCGVTDCQGLKPSCRASASSRCRRLCEPGGEEEEDSSQLRFHLRSRMRTPNTGFNREFKSLTSSFLSIKSSGKFSHLGCLFVFPAREGEGGQVVPGGWLCMVETGRGRERAVSK